MYCVYAIGIEAPHGHITALPCMSSCLPLRRPCSPRALAYAPLHMLDSCTCSAPYICSAVAYAQPLHMLGPWPQPLHKERRARAHVAPLPHRHALHVVSRGVAICHRGPARLSPRPVAWLAPPAPPTSSTASPRTRNVYMGPSYLRHSRSPSGSPSLGIHLPACLPRASRHVSAPVTHVHAPPLRTASADSLTCTCTRRLCGCTRCWHSSPDPAHAHKRAAQQER